MPRPRSAPAPRSNASNAREPAAKYLSLPVPRVVIDSNVVIDVLDDDPVWADWSIAQLGPLIAEDRAVINPIIYAELGASYESLEALEAAIGPLNLIREAMTWESAFLAGKAYKLYRKRGGTRRSPLPDFYIGAHATLAGYALLTRDAARYREYFPRLKVIAPRAR